jgi:hypothetical protein
VRALPIEVMVDKALKLLKSRRVEHIGQERFNVVGDHGTYNVVRSIDGKISCNCPGFISRGRCSHATAVQILAIRKQK